MRLSLAPEITGIEEKAAKMDTFSQRYILNSYCSRRRNVTYLGRAFGSH